MYLHFYGITSRLYYCIEIGIGVWATVVFCLCTGTQVSVHAFTPTNCKHSGKYMRGACSFGNRRPSYPGKFSTSNPPFLFLADIPPMLHLGTYLCLRWLFFVYVCRCIQRIHWLGYNSNVLRFQNVRILYTYPCRFSQGLYFQHYTDSAHRCHAILNAAAFCFRYFQ